MLWGEMFYYPRQGGRHPFFLFYFCPELSLLTRAELLKNGRLIPTSAAPLTETENFRLGEMSKVCNEVSHRIT